MTSSKQHLAGNHFFIKSICTLPDSPQAREVGGVKRVLILICISNQFYSYLTRAWTQGGRGVQDQKKSDMLHIKWFGCRGSQESSQIRLGNPESLGPRTIFQSLRLAFWAGLAALSTKSDLCWAVSGPDLYQSRSGSPAQIKGGRGGIWLSPGD